MRSLGAFKVPTLENEERLSHWYKTVKGDCEKGAYQSHEGHYDLTSVMSLTLQS